MCNECGRRTGTESEVDGFTGVCDECMDKISTSVEIVIYDDDDWYY